MQNKTFIRLPDEMRAVMRGADGAVLSRRPLPRIAPDDVLVKVSCCGICRTDLQAAAGLLGVPQGRVLGHEFAGTIAAWGARVSGWSTGEPITAFPYRLCSSSPHPDLNCMLGIAHDGAFADFVAIPAAQVKRLNRPVSFAAGAYAEPVCAALAIVRCGILPTERGCILGRNRFSTLARRVLAARGYPQVCTMDAADLAGCKDEFDFIVETGLEQQLFQGMLRALRRGGRLILKSRRPALLSFDAQDLAAREITLQGAYYGSFDEAVELINSGTLVLDGLIGDAAPLEDFANVFTRAGADEAKKLFFNMGDSECAEY